MSSQSEEIESNNELTNLFTDAPSDDASDIQTDDDSQLAVTDKSTDTECTASERSFESNIE